MGGLGRCATLAYVRLVGKPQDWHQTVYHIRNAPPSIETNRSLHAATHPWKVICYLVIATSHMSVRCLIRSARGIPRLRKVLTWLMTRLSRCRCHGQPGEGEGISPHACRRSSPRVSMTVQLPAPLQPMQRPLLVHQLGGDTKNRRSSPTSKNV